ncbi:MAG: hypothetical protein QG574_1723, partial [Cyanobacteriota bacterium erpe_2018_sw_21hr_WHONDRS-SW48-000092_B_bin.40]|nr:hypothetical protein [Cyanobacteriota bacterium erpe_2018_sw_21hr_WHONDRS-SW48-000092_B_bin.40]
MQEKNKSSWKNPLLKLLEIPIKAVIGFFMLFYLLWLKTAEPLRKQVYDGNAWHRTLGGMSALLALAGSLILLFTIAGPLAALLSLLVAVLTYSHIFPLVYLGCVKPAKKLLRWVSKVVTRVWNFVARVWNWLSAKVAAVFRWCWKQVVAFFNWVGKVVTRVWNFVARVWNWLSVKVAAVLGWCWKQVVAFCNWVSKVVARVWNFVAR